MTDTEAPTDVLIGLVLDKSGSMQPQEDAVRSGFHELIATQQAQPGTCLLSLMLFDTTQDVRFVATPVTSVDAARIPYHAYGNTALLDSFGMMIEGMVAWRAKHPEFTGQVKVVVFTDGEENASRAYSRERVNELIGERKLAGWEFIFMGSGSDAWLEGRSMSNVAGSTYNVGVGDEAVLGSFANVNASLTATRSTGVTMAAGMAAAYGDPDAQTVSQAPLPAGMRGSLRDRKAQPKGAVDELAGD